MDGQNQRYERARKMCRARGMSRLMELADILDEADEQHWARGEPLYDQGSWLHPCGTPACALGHWAAANTDRWTTHILWKPLLTSVAAGVWHSSIDCAQVDFCLDYDEASELFGGIGCGHAKTGKQAAAYIRAFVARKCAEES